MNIISSSYLSIVLFTYHCLSSLTIIEHCFSLVFTVRKLAKWMISKNAENSRKTYLKSKMSVAPKLSDGRFYWFRIGFISKTEKMKIANWKSEFPPQFATQYVKMRNAKKCWNTWWFSTISYVNGATVPMLYVVLASFVFVL